MVEELRTHNELLGRPDAPNREGRQVLILWLADLYVELTGKGGDPFALPHAEGSRFIRFCHFALAPYLPRRETRTAVLARTWKRLRAAERASKPISN